MSTATLPRCVSSCTDFPIYFIRTDADNVTGLRYVPFLPERSGWRWAEDAEIASPHIVLDQSAVAELLFLAKGEPSVMSDATAVAAIDYVLGAYHCNLKTVTSAVALEYGESWAGMAAARMSRCVVVASRLTGVTV